jgi:hypothetical protein
VIQYAKSGLLVTARAIMPKETEFSQFIEFMNSLGIHRTYIIYIIGLTCMQLQNHFSLIWYKAFTFKLLMNSMLREHPVLSVQYAMIWQPYAQWRSGDPSGTRSAWGPLWPGRPPRLL